jgi:hypothetical protein
MVAAIDFEAIWQTHKRFILQVAGGALVFLVLLSWRQSVAAEAANLTKKNAGEQAELQDDVAGLINAEGLEKGRAEALEARLEPAVLGALLWKPEPGYTLPKGDKAPNMFYGDAADKTAAAVKKHGETWNATVPKTAQELGLATQLEDARVPEGLAQADLVRRTVMRLLDAGVRHVSRVELPDPSYESREKGFLRLTPVRLTFRARTETLAKALGELQVEGSFVEITGCTVTRSPDKAGGDPLTVELELRALSIVDEAPTAVTTAAGTSGARTSRRGPRRFGRER